VSAESSYDGSNGILKPLRIGLTSEHESAERLLGVEEHQPAAQDSRRRILTRLDEFMSESRSVGRCRDHQGAFSRLQPLGNIGPNVPYQ
jgi:hypothetical protein